jgi:preprotein translocase SecE subunit
MSDTGLTAGTGPARREEAAPQKFAFGLYKYGQGYWVRILTASALGVLVMAAAMWVASELQAFPIPVKAWSMPVLGVEGEATAGQIVALRGGDDTEIGTAVVESYRSTGDSGRLEIVNWSLKNDRMSVADARRAEIRPAPGAPPTFSAEIAAPEPIPVFEHIYLQAGAALVVFLGGAGLIYWYVGLNPRTVDFLIATDGEMRKVNWSTRKVIWDSTTVVIGATFLIAAILFLADVGLHMLAKAIDLLNV